MNRPSTLDDVASGLGWAVLSLPLLGAPQGLSIIGAGGLLIATACALLFGRFTANRLLILASLAVILVDAWLLTQSSAPGAALLVAPSIGAAVGLAVGAPTAARPVSLITTALLFCASLSIYALVGRSVAIDFLVILAVVALALRLLTTRINASRSALFAIPVAVLVLAALSVIGATTPRATWFGQLTYHGPRDSNQVALTFDDGPNDPYTLQIRDILDSHGVKATFFTVGKALDARPDISKALLQDGELLGDHSYYHNNTGWLKPGYPELAQTQDAFQRQLGVCPAFYRPPHGSHTPLLSHVVNHRGLRVITWDVSAGDWATTDGDLVAQRILAGVKPGSIILLHDGIDGDVTSDRSVILSALPQILDGLKARGLAPVTLDVLLNRPGYVACDTK